MSKVMKFIWSCISLTPLFIVLGLVFLSDWLWKQTFSYSKVCFIICLSIAIVLILLFVLIMTFIIKHLDKISFGIEEIENKDDTVASGMLTYLLPLVTISFAEINWVAFGGLIIVMVILLFITRIALFNPLLYFLGYKYYSIKAESGVKYTLITKAKKFKKGESKSFVELFDNLYLEVKDKDDK